MVVDGGYHRWYSSIVNPKRKDSLSMAYDLSMLNRLRVNAGKPELKSWKAAQSLLQEKIKELQSQGFTDVVPGANINAEPVLPPDPQLAKAFEKDRKKEADEAYKKQIIDEADKNNKIIHGKSALARGAESGPFTEHSRKAVQDSRIKEQKQKKLDRKQLAKGEVDAKKEPEKAARQKKHIEVKRAKREAEGKLKPAKQTNGDEVTVATIARDLDINPKIARAKLRRHEDKLTKLHTKGQDRWTFPKTARKEIEKILRGGK